MARPPVVSQEEWQVARDELLAEEKRYTRELDALAAKRRRLPMTRIAGAGDYVFDGPEGPATLGDVFEGRDQLIVYHFMFPPGQDGSSVCVGCSTFTDNVPNLAHLNARGVTFALISRAPRQRLAAYQERMGWGHLTWYSCEGTTFNADLGLTGPDGEFDMFALSVLLRDGDDVYRTYVTDRRGVDRLRMDFNLMDLTPYGRKEAWEDSPDGWPQDGTGSALRRHDEYAQTTF
jgi:predicted dithiol-disulfide oxidoreductase (DUF899 family)